jgi:quercetin dioxygenase-like cupin family protein
MQTKFLSLAICGFSVALLPSVLPALNSSRDVKVTPLLKTSTAWNGQPIVYPQGQAEVTALTIEIAVGGQTGWHLHPVPSFAHVLQGRLDVSLKNGRVKHLKAGDTMAEVANTLHNGRNVGKIPVKLLVFYAGVRGKSLTIKESELPKRKS